MDMPPSPSDGSSLRQVACSVLDCLGGIDNVESVSHCFVRLRFAVLREEQVDEEALKAVPGVVMALWQRGEMHVVPQENLMGIYREIRSIAQR